MRPQRPDKEGWDFNSIAAAGPSPSGLIPMDAFKKVEDLGLGIDQKFML